MKKKRGFTLVAVLLCVTMFTAMMPTCDAYAETTKEKLEKAQKEHQETNEKINSTKKEIDGLNDKKESLQGELAQLNDQLYQVRDNLEELEKQIEEKEAEIEKTQKELEEAKKTEEEQYKAMKKRVQYMYEKQAFIVTDMFFGCESIADFLNKNNYIESMASYDRKMMDEYEETRKNIQNTESALLLEKEDLDKYHEEVVAEQEQVVGFVNQTASNIKNYSGQIKNAEAEAAAYEAKAAEEAANIEALQKQLAEEIAKSKLASQSKWRDISEVSFAEGDRYLMANLIYCEAGNQPYEGQVAVGAVVINRVLSSVFPDTVVGVIYQNRQFSPVASGRLALALAENRATEACYKAADEAMGGRTPVGSCVYFRTPIEGLSGIQIGGHIFY